jgi:hypothetical protein
MQANQLFNAGVAADLLRKVPTAGPSRYSLNRSHPLVEKSRQSALQVVRAFEEKFDGKHADEGPMIERLSLGSWTDSEARFWLGAMAAERCITWRQRKLVLNNNQFVQALRAELGARPSHR